MDFTLSKHAADALREREIQIAWVSATLTEPAKTEADPDDGNLTHALRPIADFGDRVLRVIFDRTRQPPHIVTVYFDRAMKGKL